MNRRNLFSALSLLLAKPPVKHCVVIECGAPDADSWRWIADAIRERGGVAWRIEHENKPLPAGLGYLSRSYIIGGVADPARASAG